VFDAIDKVIPQTLFEGPRVMKNPPPQILLKMSYSQPNVIQTEVPIPKESGLVGTVPNVLTGFPWARSPLATFDFQEPGNFLNKHASDAEKRGEMLKSFLKMNFEMAGKERIAVDVSMGEGGSHIPTASFIVPKNHPILALSQQLIFFPIAGRGGDVWGEDVPGERDVYIVVDPDRKDLSILFDSTTGVGYISGTMYIGELKKRLLSLGMHLLKKRGVGVGFHSSTKEICVYDRSGKRVRNVFVMMGMSATGKSTLGFATHGLPPEGEEYVRIANDDFSHFHYESRTFFGAEQNPYSKSNDFDDPEDRLHLGTIVSENNAVRNGQLVYGDRYAPNGRCIVSRPKIDNTFESVNLRAGDRNFFVFIQRNPTLPPIMRIRDRKTLLAYFMSVETVYTSAENVPAHMIGKTKYQVGANPFILGSWEDEAKAVKKAFDLTDATGIAMNTSSYAGIDIPKEVSIWLIEQVARDNIDWEWNDFYGAEIPSMSSEGEGFEKFNARYHPKNALENVDWGSHLRKYRELRERKKDFLRKLGPVGEDLLDAL